jgi:hypothetical protein
VITCAFEFELILLLNNAKRPGRFDCELPVELRLDTHNVQPHYVSHANSGRGFYDRPLAVYRLPPAS